MKKRKGRIGQPKAEAIARLMVKRQASVYIGKHGISLYTGVTETEDSCKKILAAFHRLALDSKKYSAFDKIFIEELENVS